MSNQEYTKLLADMAADKDFLFQVEEEPYSATKDENSKEALEAMYRRF